MAYQTANAIITSVSTSLNDQEVGFTFIRWPLAELTTFLNEGLSFVCAYRPDAFIFRGDITITQGSQQTLPATLRLLKTVDFNSGSSNCPFAPITECDLNLARTFYKATCLPTGGAGDYRVLAYGYDAKDPRAFYVFPPVPAGNTANISITAIQEPTVYDTTSGSQNSLVNIDPNYYAPLKFWMLARAYEVDTESSTSQSESDKFYQKAYNYFGVQYKQGSGYNKGAFLGQGGDQNMTKQRPA